MRNGRLGFEFAGAVADHYVDDDRFLAIFGSELLFDGLYKVVIEFVGHEVDGATSESAAHDARTGDAFFAGNVVEEVEFFAAYLILLAESVVSLMHLLTYSLIVTSNKCVTNSEYALLLTENEVCTLVVFSTNLVLNSL